MKNRISSVIVFCLAAFGTISLQGQVTVYKDCDYKGSSRSMDEGTYNADNLGIGNDQMSSIRIPRGYSVTIYSDNNLRGVSQNFNESVSCLPANMNDKVSSIRVRREYGSGSGGGGGMVTLYKDCDYKGTSHALGDGTYNADQLGIGNDVLSSMRIPRGYRVTVFTDNNQRGSSRTFDENVSCMPSDLNDKVSSISISRGSGYQSGGGYGQGVVLFKDCDYRGNRSESLQLGTYYADELGIGNDQLSSMRIPRGWKVTVYTDNDLRGYSETFFGDVPCLSGTMNDKASSIRISKR